MRDVNADQHLDICMEKDVNVMHATECIHYRMQCELMLQNA